MPDLRKEMMARGNAMTIEETKPYEAQGAVAREVCNQIQIRLQMQTANKTAATAATAAPTEAAAAAAQPLASCCCFGFRRQFCRGYNDCGFATSGVVHFRHRRDGSCAL